MILDTCTLSSLTGQLNSVALKKALLYEVQVHLQFMVEVKADHDDEHLNQLDKLGGGNNQPCNRPINRGKRVIPITFQNSYYFGFAKCITLKILLEKDNNQGNTFPFKRSIQG